MLLRFVIVLALIGVLWFMGVVDLGSLPWHLQEFRVGGATVIIYLLWSAAESRYRKGDSASLPYLVFYSVLLVSALDSFLLEITVYGGPWALRWAGLLLFSLGSGIRIIAFRKQRVQYLRLGRYLQLAGLPVALGSIAGTAVALAAGVPGSIHEEMNLKHEDDAE